MVNLQLCVVSVEFLMQLCSLWLADAPVYGKDGENSRSRWSPDKRLCGQKPVYRLAQLRPCFIEPSPVSQDSSMCQHQEGGTLELDACRLGPTLPRRTAALDPLDRSVKIPQAPMNGS